MSQEEKTTETPKEETKTEEAKEEESTATFEPVVRPLSFYVNFT